VTVAERAVTMIPFIIPMTVNPDIVLNAIESPTFLLR